MTGLTSHGKKIILNQSTKSLYKPIYLKGADMVTMSLDEWNAKAEELFGTKDFREWKFVCPMCGNVQSFKDFEGLVDDPENYVHFSCIGRFKNDIGCDWTLGGFLQIHKTEVIDKEGETHRVFEFATDEKGEEHPIRGFAKK